MYKWGPNSLVHPREVRLKTSEVFVGSANIRSVLLNDGIKLERDMGEKVI